MLTDEQFLGRVARHVVELRWDDLPAAVRERFPVVLLDALGCGFVGERLGFHAAFSDMLAEAGGVPEATVWVRGERLPAAHAALVNGTVAHHAELDDADSRASLHGGVTVIPAALAVAEQVGASGVATAEAIVAGYNASIACGRTLIAGISQRRLHPPSMVGCFGAAAAAARLRGLDADGVVRALSLTGTLLPLGPFEAFTKGAPIKDLYGGWPAYLGVLAAELAADGLGGPLDVLDNERDGLAAFLPPGPWTTANVEAEADELVHVGFKAFATCRSVHPALTALENVDVGDLPHDEIESIDVETYPYAVGLSVDSDPTTAIGAKTSVGYGLASRLVLGNADADAFAPRYLADPRIQSLAARVRERVAEDMRHPVVRGARVAITTRDGKVRRFESPASRWSTELPASDGDLREKFRRLAGSHADAVEQNVDALVDAPDLDALMRALGRPE